MATSRQWKVLQDMRHEGAYPEVLRQYADAIARDGTVEAGKRVTVAASYREALGCGAG